MIVAPTRSYTTSDLRRPAVLDEAYQGPVAVRDGKTGNLILMLPMEMVERSNALSSYTQLLCRVVIECQRADPSPAVLGPVGYITNWSPDRRSHFVRGLAEALAAGAEQNSPEIVDAYIEVMAHADDSLPAQFDPGAGTAADRRRVRRHVGAPTQQPKAPVG